MESCDFCKKDCKDQLKRCVCRKVFDFTSNLDLICGEEDLYSNTTEMGLYYNWSLINHACIPNATRRHQVRALMVIEKDEEILVSYQEQDNFIFGSREFRRQKLLEIFAFLCGCSECSLEGEDLEGRDHGEDWRDRTADEW